MLLPRILFPATVAAPRLAGTTVDVAPVVVPGTPGTFPLDTADLRLTNFSGATYLARPATTDKRAYLDNSYTILEKIERLSAATGLPVPVTGLTLTGSLAATPGGAPLLSAPLAEGPNGAYAAVFPTADLAAALATFVDQTVYEVIVSADGALRIVHPVLVRSLRMGT